MIQNPIKIFRQSHAFNHRGFGSNPSKEGTHPVGCTTLNLTVWSHEMTWAIQNKCCDFNSEYKVHGTSTSKFIKFNRSANDQI